ncbi:hypothetical protein GGR53DRAFT_507328, partial [Hypoxylon sp. FL1150]
MADQDRSKIIRDNPIGNGFNAFLASFSSLCESKNVTCSGGALDQLSDEEFQNITIDLLLALQYLRASRLLLFTGKNLFTHLASLTTTVDSEAFDYDRIKPILRLVIAKEPDEKIWAQVYHALIESTPPLSRNIDVLVYSSEHRIDTDDVLKENLGPMYVNIPGFYKAFFGRIPDLERASEAIFKMCCEGPDPMFREGWLGWPRDANEPSVLSWLEKIIEQLMQWAQNYRQTPDRGLWIKSDKPLDVGILRYPGVMTDWSQVLIPGELKSNPKEDRQTGAWFGIAKYVREVFLTQDTRRFVLAFTLCGPLMRVWEFDRLGGIASTQFDINKDGLQFVSIILGFLWMEEKDLGFDPTIITSNNVQYIDIIRDGTPGRMDGTPERIVIDKVIERVRCIAGRATTCWKAHPKSDPSTTVVIKDSWQDPERDAEGELLREVTEKGIRNVARYYYHETIHIDGRVDNIQHGIRQGLDITQASNFQPQGSDTISTAGQKRSSSQADAPIKVNPARNSTLQDRVHRRVIVRDYGRNISEASSRVALLMALDECIEGHKSLHGVGILHRDISINNLLINEDKGNPSWPGFLIDLDLAIREQCEGASGAKGET